MTAPPLYIGDQILKKIYTSSKSEWFRLVVISLRLFHNSILSSQCVWGKNSRLPASLLIYYERGGRRECKCSMCVWERAPFIVGKEALRLLWANGKIKFLSHSHMLLLFRNLKHGSRLLIYIFAEADANFTHALMLISPYTHLYYNLEAPYLKHREREKDINHLELSKSKYQIGLLLRA